MARGTRTELSEEDKKRKLNKEGLQQIFWIFNFSKPYRLYFIIGLGCLLLSALATLVFPKLAEKLIDIALGNEKRFTLTQIGLSLMGVLLLNGVFSFFRVQTFAKVTENAMRDLRITLYSKLVSLPVPFFESRRVGELTSRLTSDVTQLQDVLSWALAEFIRQVITLVGASILMSIWYPKLTVFMLATFPVLIIGAMFFGKYIRKLSKKSQDSHAAANTIVVETLQAIQAVKAFTNEPYEIKRYGSGLQDALKNALRSAFFRGLFISFIVVVLFGSFMSIIWYASFLLSQSKDLTSGNLFGFVIYTAFVGGSVAGLGDLYTLMQRAIGSSERIREILAEKSEEGTLPLTPNAGFTGDIRFENVEFSYPTRPDIQVLKNISLHIKSGQKVALVGHSGAGKSTITSLLLRYYYPQSGHISISGVNIEAMDLQELRKHIGIVPQDVILFGGTIEENIRYGRPDASVTEIRDAARKANALQFIEAFPEGFKTLVGERGVKLSGGQRQRIAIARAILKDPEILILDEATSSLDAESEKLVQDALDELMQNRTTIIIAHRLATIRKVDYIYVLGEGKIQEVGSHAELAVSETGIYSNLLRLQFDVH